MGQGAGQAMGWDGAGRRRVLRPHPTESGCTHIPLSESVSSPQPRIYRDSPVEARVQGWSWVAGL